MPKGKGYGPKSSSERSKKRAAKDTAKKINVQKKQAPTKRHGVAVMKTDPNNPNRKTGYVAAKKTKLPKYDPLKPTTKAGRKGLRKVRGK